MTHSDWALTARCASGEPGSDDESGPEHGEASGGGERTDESTPAARSSAVVRQAIGALRSMLGPPPDPSGEEPGDNEPDDNEPGENQPGKDPNPPS